MSVNPRKESFRTRDRLTFHLSIRILRGRIGSKSTEFVDPRQASCAFAEVSRTTRLLRELISSKWRIYVVRGASFVPILRLSRSRKSSHHQKRIETVQAHGPPLNLTLKQFPAAILRSYWQKQRERSHRALSLFRSRNKILP